MPPIRARAAIHLAWRASVPALWFESASIHGDGQCFLATAIADARHPEIEVLGRAVVTAVAGVAASPHTVPVLDRGVVTRVVVPAFGVSWERLITMLLSVDDADELDGDVRYLHGLANAVTAWIAAGRVLPFYDGQLRWELRSGPGSGSWLTPWVRALPASMRVDVPDPAAFVAMVVGELTDRLTRRRLAAEPVVTTQRFTSLLLEGTEFEATTEFTRALDRWRSSVSATESDLVLRLHEPPGTDELATPTAEALWPLQLYARQRVTGTPIPLDEATLVAPAAAAAALALWSIALETYPRLRDVPQAAGSSDVLLPTAVVIDFVRHGASLLRGVGIGIQLPRSWIRAQPTLRLRAESVLASDELSTDKREIVDFGWELALGDDVLTKAELVVLASAQAPVVLLRRQWVYAESDVLSRAARYVMDRGSGRVDLVDFMTHASESAPLPVSLEISGWLRSLRHPGEQPDPEGLRATLRPYQRVGVAWLAELAKAGLGALLADDMGLGKTIQVIALTVRERSPLPTLVVCPMSVVGNWEREFARFAPDLAVLVHHGPARLAGPELVDSLRGVDVVITTFAVASADTDLAATQWRRVVVDEAQHIKNPRTIAARALRRLDAQHRVALTGTPVENRLAELHALLDYANPGLFGSRQTFRARYAIPIERDRNHAALQRFRMIASPFILRRVKTDPAVAGELPEKFEATVTANLTREQAVLYQAVVDDMLTRIRESEDKARRALVLSTIVRLKMVCNHPAQFLNDGSAATRRGKHRSGKLELVDDLVDTVVDSGEKVLLFTQFRQFGDLVSQHLKQHTGLPVEFLHGGSTRSERDAMVQRFGESHGPGIFVLSLRAGGTGLNLAAANHVVHLDRWWNPAVENQATDRAYRIGQTRAVQVRKLLCVGTIEERIEEMIHAKSELADLAVSAGETWLADLSDDQIFELTRLGEGAVGE